MPTIINVNKLNNQFKSSDVAYKFKVLKPKERGQNFHLLQHLIVEGVVVLQNGRIQECNQSMQAICGYSLEELSGMPIKNIFHPDSFSAIEQFGNQSICDNRIIKGHETVLICKDGHQANVEITTDFITFNEKPANLVVIRDISDQIKAKKELEKASKVESIAALAGGIAHDYNNLLTAIIGNISLTRATLNPDDNAFSFLSQALSASKTAQNLTQKLITFSQGGEPVKNITETAVLVKSATEFTLSGTTIKSEYEFQDHLWSVAVDQTQIGHAIHNVALNAREAMKEGGNLKVTAKNTIINKGFKNLKPGKYVKISIADRGDGISEDRLDKIFEPYYTTKEFGVQKGAGLGLSISKSIIKKHGGDVAVKSRIGFGTTFSMYLPADHSEAICKDTAVEVEGKRSIFGNGKILVMDDEEIIRTLTKHILNHLGYDAEFARDGKEAIDLYRNALRCGKPFDAVILDLTIRGGIGGQEAIKKLSEIDPNVKGIVSSGYSQDPVMANFRDFGFCDVIAKPYTVEEMGDKLNQVFEKAM